MAAPMLEIDVDLSQQDTIYYLPLAPKSRNDGERLKIGVRLKIKHIDSAHSELRITGISFSFPGTNIDKIDMDEVPEKNMDPEDGRLTLNQTANWFNGSYRFDDGVWHHNQVYLDAPAPQQMRIHIYCDGFSHAYTETFNLRPWTGEALIMPFSKEDLDDNEYIVTSAVHHFNGPPNGTQIFAHDISIQAKVNGTWTRTHTGTAKTNEDFRSFGLAVRGQGTGVVDNVETGYLDNVYGKGNRDDNYGANRVTVLYGNLKVIYSHLRQDSIVVQKGDHVWAGRKLAESGNSGNTKGNPHLHMQFHLMPNDKLCGMTFKNCWMVERGGTTDELHWDDRVRVKAQGICKETAVIRPFSSQRIPPSTHTQPLTEEAETLVAEVFGGTTKGGDGFVIINGKLTRVPPRGIKNQLLNAIVDIDEAEEKLSAEAKSRFKKIILGVEKAIQKFKSEY